MSDSNEPSTLSGRRPSQRDPLLGTWLDDRFLIEERIATGGFGAIYRARTADGMPLALKVLHPRLSGDPSMVARFQREGATLTQLHDPHTVTTFAVGETADGVLYIAMELLSGESLHDRLERDRVVPWQAAVAIARAVCSSLAEAHALGVVHRDLKPANIHVETRGGVELVKVIDFGIVKIARGSAIDDGQELTRAGHMIGTYDYMSPEQVVGGECREASDIYSLGVVLYEMLTGERPFAKLGSPAGMMTALLTQTPQPPSVLAAIPHALDRIVMRCLERDPEQRFPNVIELAATLGRVLARRPTPREDVTAVHPVLSASQIAAPAIDPRPAGAAVGGPTPRDRTSPIDDAMVRAPTERDVEDEVGYEADATIPEDGLWFTARAGRRERTLAPEPQMPRPERRTPPEPQIAHGTGPGAPTSKLAAVAPRNTPATDPAVSPHSPASPVVTVASRNTPATSPPVSSQPPPAVSPFTTLQGVAVVTERRSSPGVAVAPVAPSPVLPMTWQITPTRTPISPHAGQPLARGSRPSLPRPSHSVLWVALVLAGLVAIVVAAAI